MATCLLHKGIQQKFFFLQISSVRVKSGVRCINSRESNTAWKTVPEHRFRPARHFRPAAPERGFGI